MEVKWPMISVSPAVLGQLVSESHINDAVINDYLKLISDLLLSKKVSEKIHFFSSFLLSVLGGEELKTVF